MSMDLAQICILFLAAVQIVLLLQLLRPRTITDPFQNMLMELTELVEEVEDHGKITQQSNDLDLH